MNKSILIIDTPENCKNCIRYKPDPWFGGVCYAIKGSKYIEPDYEFEIQPWCPLKPYQEAIPVKWIEKWVRNDPTADPDTFTDMVADWRKENAKTN